MVKEGLPEKKEHARKGPKLSLIQIHFQPRLLIQQHLFLLNSWLIPFSTFRHDYVSNRNKLHLMFKKLRTVIYHVTDINAAKEWYSKATGIKPYFDEAFYVGFDINGFELGLDPDNKNFTKGNNSISYWAVDDVSMASSKLVSIGGTLIQPKTNVGGTIEVSIVEDPFGNCIGLIEGA